MKKTEFIYQSEKFSMARSLLMLPHPEGENVSVYHAFIECSHGLHDLDKQGLELDDYAKNYVAKLKVLMDTSSVPDPDSRGLFAVKADLLTTEQKTELSQVIVALSDWFKHSLTDN